jgi:Ca2+-binding EF-hand superfamily protein
LQEAFSIFDKNGDGALSAEEIGALLEALGTSFDLEQIRTAMMKIDEDGNGEIDFQEFLEMMKRKRKKATSYEDDLKAAFAVFDKDGDGDISGVEIGRVFKALGETSTYRVNVPFFHCSSCERPCHRFLRSLQNARTNSHSHAIITHT